MNYEAMSDFEINKAVTLAANGLEGWALSDDKDCFYCCDAGGDGRDEIAIADYCNNPAHMWPIIVGNEISVIPPASNGTNGWKAERFYPSNFGKIIDFIDKKPLRAAAIVFLMMKEAEK